MAAVHVVPATLFEGGFRAALAGRFAGGVDPVRLQQLADRARDRVAVKGIGVEIAGDQEAGIRIDTAAAALVVNEPIGGSMDPVIRGVPVIVPETDFIEVAQPVAVFGAVEYRRGGVVSQQVQFRTVDLDHDVPVALRTQPQAFPDVLGIVRAIAGFIGRGQAGPGKVLERTGAVLEHRVPRQQ